MEGSLFVIQQLLHFKRPQTVEQSVINHVLNFEWKIFVEVFISLSQICNHRQIIDPPVNSLYRCLVYLELRVDGSEFFHLLLHKCPRGRVVNLDLA